MGDSEARTAAREGLVTGSLLILFWIVVLIVAIVSVILDRTLQGVVGTAA